MTAWDNIGIDGKLSKVTSWVFNVLELKKFVEANTDIPLVIFFPEFLGSNSSEHKKLKIDDVCKKLTLKTFRDAFGYNKDFDKVDEFVEFLNNSKDSDLREKFNFKQIHELIGHNSLLDPFKMPASLAAMGISRMTSNLHNANNGVVTKKTIFDLMIYVQVTYNLIIMREVNGSFLNSEIGSSDLLFSGWNQRNKYIENEYLRQPNIQQNSILNMSLETRFTWLNTLSIDECIRLRENGYLDEMRKMFSIENKQLALSSDKEYAKLSAKYEETIKALILEESEKMALEYKDIRKEYNLSAISLGIASILTVGSFVVPPLGIISAILGLGYGTKSVKDLIGAHEKKGIYKNSIQFRPSTVLLKHLKSDNLKG